MYVMLTSQRENIWFGVPLGLYGFMVVWVSFLMFGVFALLRAFKRVFRGVFKGVYA